MQLVKICTITGTIETVTGLHIGAGKESIEIGGMDNPVIKHPHTGEPYIPGSSLKGKLRSLLEWALHKVEPDGAVWGSDNRRELPDTDEDEILRIFGTTHKSWNGGPTRVSIRDCHLTERCRKSIHERGLQFTEEKTEVVIDRIQGKAAGNIGPRKTERVPAGMEFDLEIQFRVIDNRDGGRRDMECLNRLIEGLKLLERDALGGSGSRGYGKVRFRNLAVNGKSIQEKFDGIREIKPSGANPIVEA
ncbi:MAG: type III-A CRISPR-associated RAMP protein Csm3 [Bryobacteraceae bacterium]